MTMSPPVRNTAPVAANLIVQLGVVTEPLNRIWYERNTANPMPKYCIYWVTLCR